MGHCRPIFTICWSFGGAFLCRFRSRGWRWEPPFCLVFAEASWAWFQVWNFHFPQIASSSFYFLLVARLPKQWPQPSPFLRYGDMPAHNLLWRECEKTSDNVAARLAAIPLVQVISRQVDHYKTNISSYIKEIKSSIVCKLVLSFNFCTLNSL